MFIDLKKIYKKSQSKTVFFLSEFFCTYQIKEKSIFIKNRYNYFKKKHQTLPLEHRNPKKSRQLLRLPRTHPSRSPKTTTRMESMGR
jgi:hypothetical protein